MSTNRPEHNERIEKLELAAGYAERHVEVLSDEIVKLNTTIATLKQRLDRLESRVVEINDKVGEAPPIVPPPHSAGPDVPRDPI